MRSDASVPLIGSPYAVQDVCTRTFVIRIPVKVTGFLFGICRVVGGLTRGVEVLAILCSWWLPA